MASTNKTPQLGLNQWAAGDEVLRADFNADNLKLDALLNHSGCIVSSFVGDGSNNHVVDVGVKPKLIIIFGMYETAYYTMGFLIGKEFYNISSSGVNSISSSGVVLTENGFQILRYSYFNAAGKTSTYIAFY